MPADHPDKALEGGSQSTPGEFIDWLLDVAEACNRVLAPHGSLCIELGDTYAGGGTGLANYSDDRGNPDGMRDTTFSGGNTKTGGGSGWPLAKSLSLIPESFRFAMVYGFNPHTGRTTEPWRLRNVIRWVRPNPPVGALGDKFRPATSELMVFCKSAKRYFDLDAVREPVKHPLKSATTGFDEDGNRRRKLNPYDSETQSAGAPPLDWWNITLLEGEEETRYGPKEKPAVTPRAGHPKQEAMKAEGVVTHGVSVGLVGRTYNKDGGAPPLDWWEIPPGGYEGAHYAVFPPELCVKPVKAMCPEKVCRQCGEPSRRIVKDRSAFDRQPALAAHIKERREAAGITSDEINGWFGFKEIAKNWERVDKWGAAIPNAEVWPILKERLGLSDEFDDLVCGERRWTDDPTEYIGLGPNGRTNKTESPYQTQRADGLIRPTLGWTGCRHFRCQVANTVSDNCGSPTGPGMAPGHESCYQFHDWRPGVVLDPFAGSGTTLAVATGHGRDAIGIDLDERNFDLALERVGPFILTRGDLDEEAT